jgi:hypothetical protein
MAKLTTKKRANLPKSTFALPGGTKANKKPGFPLNDPNHDRSAISGATRSKNAGNISDAQMKAIKAKAKTALGKGKSKK